MLMTLCKQLRKMRVKMTKKYSWSKDNSHILWAFSRFRLSSKKLTMTWSRRRDLFSRDLNSLMKLGKKCWRVPNSYSCTPISKHKMPQQGTSQAEPSQHSSCQEWKQHQVPHPVKVTEEIVSRLGSRVPLPSLNLIGVQKRSLFWRSWRAR